MSICLVTGSAGLVGSESVRFFASRFDKIIGVDNDQRAVFFGPSASTAWNVQKLKQEFSNYIHLDLDIRNTQALETLFQSYGSEIKLIIHAAAQPSHDWAARDPQVDFSINAVATLNLLETLRKFCPEAVFIFTSTNKVYGDRPNQEPLIELENRFELSVESPYAQSGFDENLSIDQSMHSLFGISKCSADLMVQEYGRYFGLKTVSFRGGCLTGPGHSGAVLHGFLAYLVKCVYYGIPYAVLGYKGKQVRDNIHSYDLIQMFWHFYQNPRCGEVYNAGGSRHSNCSVLEAIELTQKLAGKALQYQIQPSNRQGDHIFWVSDVSKFRSHYPDWEYSYDLPQTIQEILDGFENRQGQGPEFSK